MAKQTREDLCVVVPARLGSNRIKVKNLRLLNGRPLIEYTLNILKKTKHLRNIYINSDSEYFGEIARRNGVKFYKRDPKLATSKSLIDDYIYDFIVNVKPKYLAVVNPTSPFVEPEHLDRAWEYFLENDFDTLLSCENIQTHCFYKGKAINFSTDCQHPRSQDLIPVQALNFAITIWKCDRYRKNYEEKGHGVYTGKLGFFPTEGTGNIDVDSEEDFMFAEFVVRFLESNAEYEVAYSDVIKDLIENNVDTRN